MSHPQDGAKYRRQPAWLHAARRAEGGVVHDDSDAQSNFSDEIMKQTDPSHRNSISDQSQQQTLIGKGD